MFETGSGWSWYTVSESIQVDDYKGPVVMSKDSDWYTDGQGLNEGEVTLGRVCFKKNSKT